MSGLFRLLKLSLWVVLSMLCLGSGRLHADPPEYWAHTTARVDFPADEDTQSDSTPVIATATDDSPDGHAESLATKYLLDQSFGGIDSYSVTTGTSRGKFFFDRNGWNPVTHDFSGIVTIGVSAQWAITGEDVFLADRGGLWKFYWVDNMDINGGILLMSVSLSREGAVNVYRRNLGWENEYYLNAANDSFSESVRLCSDAGIPITRRGYIRVEYTCDLDLECFDGNGSGTMSWSYPKQIGIAPDVEPEDPVQCGLADPA